jgi:methionyl-tRNA synthetase
VIKLKKKFYITTTIPYANAPPHIGHTLEFVQADALARWHKQAGYDVFFLTGTDEHGTKNYQTAKKLSVPTKKFVDRNTQQFRLLTKIMNISNDEFIRTTDQKVHWPGVNKMWKILAKNGDIYKKKYEGNYCAGCERFVTDKDLINGKCPDHPTLNIEHIAEENYFFRLSRYSNRITKLIQTDKLKIYPKKYKNDFLSLIKDGIYDVSFSRNKKVLPWGVPVPGDSDQVMYVWCDALTNYLTGIGYPSVKYKKYWPADIHAAGKDMLRFHAGIWPGMLLSVGLPLPKEITVHGFITSEGIKMGKSNGNVVDPFEEVKKYGTDAVRYYLLREIPTGSDGDYSRKSVVSRFNNELANELGNLLSRSLTLIERNGGTVPKGKFELNFDGKKVQKWIDKRELHKALEEIWALISKTNEYIAKKQPWTKPKDLDNILFNLAEALRWISALTWPFIPETSEKIAKQLGLKKVPTFADLKKPVYGNKVKKLGILFTKIEEKTETKEVIANKVSGSDCVTKKTRIIKNGLDVKKMINFKDFEKIDLRVGKILKVENHPNADKLYKMQVDFGAEKRQVLAGIRQWYKPADLVGKSAVFIVNLEPRKIRGEESQAMILAAESGKDVAFISPTNKNIKPGSKIH